MSYRTFLIKIILLASFSYLIGYLFVNTKTLSIIKDLPYGKNLEKYDSFMIPSNSIKDQYFQAFNVTQSTSVNGYLKELSTLEKVKLVTNCINKPFVHKIQQRGDYWVLYNYIKARRSFKCHESITYTTHADFSFMDNLLPLLERWQGPISIALHAPGTDFKCTLDSIAYLRECSSDLVKDFVTFHIYFSTKHVPKEVRTLCIDKLKTHEFKKIFKITNDTLFFNVLSLY